LRHMPGSCISHAGLLRTARAVAMARCVLLSATTRHVPVAAPIATKSIPMQSPLRTPVHRHVSRSMVLSRQALMLFAAARTQIRTSTQRGLPSGTLTTTHKSACIGYKQQRNAGTPMRDCIWIVHTKSDR
jgi:hypothetical protein